MENIVRRLDTGLFAIIVNGEVRRIMKAEMKEAVKALLCLLKKK